MLTGCAVPSSRPKHEPTGLLSCRASLKNIGTPPCLCRPPPARLMEAAACRLPCSPAAACACQHPLAAACAYRRCARRPRLPLLVAAAPCAPPLACCGHSLLVDGGTTPLQQQPGRERRLPAGEGKEGCKGRRAQLGGEGRGGEDRAGEVPIAARGRGESTEAEG